MQLLCSARIKNSAARFGGVGAADDKARPFAEFVARVAQQSKNNGRALLAEARDFNQIQRVGRSSTVGPAYIFTRPFRTAKLPFRVNPFKREGKTNARAFFGARANKGKFLIRRVHELRRRYREMDSLSFRIHFYFHPHTHTRARAHVHFIVQNK